MVPLLCKHIQLSRFKIIHFERRTTRGTSEHATEKHLLKICVGSQWHGVLRGAETKIFFFGFLTYIGKSEGFIALGKNILSLIRYEFLGFNSQMFLYPHMADV